MASTHSKKASVENKQIQEMTKKWFTRRRLRQVSKGLEDPEADQEQLLCREHGLRPQTAPSTPTASKPYQFTTSLEPPLVRRCHDPPPRPPRPDSSVMRDVNAWLDASVIKPAQIVSGIPYWRDGAATSETTQSEVKYTIPIVETPGNKSGVTGQSHHHTHFFCRHPKKRQVKMPSLLRSRSHRIIRSQSSTTPRRSLSMPLLSLDTDTGEASVLNSSVTSRSLMNLIPCSSDHSSLTSNMRRFRIRDISGTHSSGHGSGVTVGTGGAESAIDRHINAFSERSPTLADFPRLAASITGVNRQASTANLSEAPTYYSGAPPPSYRSRAVSIRTTSSFGCVDGMGAEYRRQMKYHKKRDRSMKERLKKFAQKARLRI